MAQTINKQFTHKECDQMLNILNGIRANITSDNPNLAVILNRVEDVMSKVTYLQSYIDTDGDLK